MAGAAAAIDGVEVMEPLLTGVVGGILEADLVVTPGTVAGAVPAVGGLVGVGELRRNTADATVVYPAGGGCGEGVRALAPVNGGGGDSSS